MVKSSILTETGLSNLIAWSKRHSVAFDTNIDKWLQDSLDENPDGLAVSHSHTLSFGSGLEYGVAVEEFEPSFLNLSGYEELVAVKPV